MNNNLVMGLRPDVARQILINNRYDKREVVQNDLTPIVSLIFAVSMIVRECVSSEMKKMRSATWLNGPAATREIPIISLIIEFLGVCVFIYTLKIIRNMNSKAEQINARRERVMEIIDHPENVFNSPFEGTHVLQLIHLTDKKTQKELLDFSSREQLSTMLRHKNLLSNDVIVMIQERIHNMNFLSEDG